MVGFLKNLIRFVTGFNGQGIKAEVISKISVGGDLRKGHRNKHLWGGLECTRPTWGIRVPIPIESDGPEGGHPSRG